MLSSPHVDGGSADAATAADGASSASPAAGGAAGQAEVSAPIGAPGDMTAGASAPSSGAAGAPAPSETSSGSGANASTTADPSGGAGAPVSTSAPSGGADAGAPVCEAGEMRCSEGCTKTCQADGTWGPAVSCPGHQTCSISTGESKCVCKVDGFCGSTPGPTCDSPSSFINCATDAYGCVFQTPPTKCAHACEGLPGAALCSEGPCTTLGETRCESSFTLETCSATEGGNAFVAADCAAGTVCGRNAPASCLDANWADWPMPNGLLDAANGAPNPQRFTDNRDGSLTDNVTGLDWAWVDFYAETLADAWDVCEGMHLLDEGDWRVPSLIELISIADFGQPSNINEAFFPPPNDLLRWTTTLRGDGSDEHFAFDFAAGQVFFIDDQSHDDLRPKAITCVR